MKIACEPLGYYRFVDCGDGRKLESFAGYLVDRPSPAAVAPTRQPQAWTAAQAHYQRGSQTQGQWTSQAAPPEPWIFEFGSLRLELRQTEFGHVGIFPEQADNWRWLAEQCRTETVAASPANVLNLFAYTGASTLACAAAGASLTHIDAAQATVNWARRNADLSGLAEQPIRWIAEDAPKFVSRELKRGRRYDAVIFDPPSYGHGASGEAWQFERDIGQLLADCRKLTDRAPRFMLLTCHTPGVGPADAAQLLATTLPRGESRRIEAFDLILAAESGARLHCGVCARWSCDRPAE